MTLLLAENSQTDHLGNSVVALPRSLFEQSRYSQVLINDLPTELLIHVFSNLDPVYLNTMRLVCKRWNFVINDRQTWINSFNLKFNTPVVFPSLTNSANWMLEYFTRLQVIKNWKKGTALHSSYQLINNEYRFNDCILTNFSGNSGLGRILVFSKKYGNIALSNLKNGKNQSFIPGGNPQAYENLSFALNWNHLLIGKLNGEIHLKNLLTSTSSGSTRSSSTVFADPVSHDKSPVMVVEINLSGTDKYKLKVDVISGSFAGSLKLWNMNGQVVKLIRFPGEIILNVKSNFKKFIVVTTDCCIHIVDYNTYDVVATMELGFSIENHEEPTIHGYYDTFLRVRNTLDVDFGNSNIVVCYQSIVKVFNFKDLNNIHERQVVLPEGVFVIKSKMQTISNNKINGTRNPRIIGGDGLLFANSLSDDTVIIWNVREDENYRPSTITPHCTIRLTFRDIKYTTQGGVFDYILDRNLPFITSIALNSSIIAIGGYNGVANAYDVFTGKFIKEIYVKFPKRFNHMYDELIPITDIKLNDNQQDASGVIVCGDTMQYFQFGETRLTVTGASEGGKKQKANVGSYNKHESKKKIKDGWEDYDTQRWIQKKQQDLFDKYNGQLDEDDDELSLALALSQSVHHNSGKIVEGESEENSVPSHVEDDDLKIAIELSKQLNEEELNYNEAQFDLSSRIVSDEPIATSSRQAAEINDEEDEVMRRVLELSLHEH